MLSRLSSHVETSRNIDSELFQYAFFSQRNAAGDFDLNFEADGALMKATMLCYVRRMSHAIHLRHENLEIKAKRSGAMPNGPGPVPLTHSGISLEEQTRKCFATL